LYFLGLNLKRWWDKREEYASSRHKTIAEKLSSEKFKGKYPEMENNLDAWAQELREAGCCLSGFTLKVKALGILRELGQFDGKFYASGGWLHGFLRRKNYTLRRIITTGRKTRWKRKKKKPLKKIIINNLFNNFLIDF
jgi:hypothetical protein